MARIFVIGSTGMLGRYIATYFSKLGHDVICITRDQVDASTATFHSLFLALGEHSIVPDEENILINCVGIIPQSKSVNDTSSRSYFRINSLFPMMLATVCREFKMKYIHITTDCVFSGKGGNYTEDSAHDETNDYGVSKSLGELGINATIIRTSIIGEETKNKYSLLEWVKSQKDNSVTGYVNHYWNGVTCLQMAKIINKMISEKKYWHGVRHIFSPTSVSKYQLVKMISFVYNLNVTVTEHHTSENVDKTLASVHDTCKLFNIPELQTQLIELQQYRE